MSAWRVRFLQVRLRRRPRLRRWRGRGPLPQLRRLLCQGARLQASEQGDGRGRRQLEGVRQDVFAGDVEVISPLN